MSKSQALKQKYSKEIKQIKETLVRKYKPKKVILFGSCANGKLKPYSDIDIMVIKNTSKPRIERIKEVLSMLNNKLPVDILVYTPQEFKRELQLGEFIFEDISKQGKILYERK